MLDIVAVEKSYGPTRVLDRLSLSVARGELLTLLGPSGSGKSTVLSIIAGLLPPDRGRVVIAGADRTNDHPRHRNIGFVFQGYALFPTMSARDNVAYPLRNRGVPREEAAKRAERILDSFGLSGQGSKLPSQLSGGQQQRVALARAMVFEPAVLLLDEPLSALDRQLRLHLRRELQQIHRRTGATILFVTHDQEEALALSDRICVMNRGAVEQVDRPSEIYLSPATRFVAEFIGGGAFLRMTPEMAAAIGAAIPRERDRRTNGHAEAELFLRADDVAVLVDRPPSGWPWAVAEDRLVIPASIDSASFLGSRVEVQCMSALGSIEALVDRNQCPPDLSQGLTIALACPLRRLSIF